MGVLAFAEFEVDLELFQLRHRGKPVEISARGFDLLLYLIRNRERVVPKSELLAQVWRAQALSSSAIPTAVLGLRKALGDDPDSPRFIENTPGRGYRFIHEIRISEAGSSIRTDGAHADHHSEFVGRVLELSAIGSAFDRCLRGAPQTILLAGDAGIGKTRTAEEFTARARMRGAMILVGRCREGEGAPAFWPWVQVVRGLVEQLEPSRIDRDVRPLAAVLSQMVPELEDRFPGLEPPSQLDAEPARFRLFDTVTRLIQRAGLERPVLILLDDLHRADPASLHFLAFVARELRDTQVLFVVTYRDVDAQRDPPRLTAISELARQEPSRSIQLHGLSPSEVGDFVATSRLRGSETDNLTRALYEQSGGNPFFLIQLVRLLQAEGSTAKLEGDLEVAGTLPRGVREAIAMQLEGLSDDTRRVLSAAAAIGREFPASVVADILDVSMREVLALVEPAVDARLVISGTDRVALFRFAHILLRDTIYEQLGTVERIDLHRRIGNSLERLYADDPGPHAAELAYHFGEAIHEGGGAQAVRYAVRAGEWASARLAYEDAAGHYRNALKTLEESGPGNLVQRCGLLLALGEAQMNAGQRDRARETLYQAAAVAKSGAQVDLLGRAALRLAPGFFTIEIGVFDTLLVSLLEDAIEAVGAADSPLRAQLLARLAMAHGWTGDERRARLTAEAVRVAERVGDPGALAYALSANHGLLWGPERVAERVALIDRMGSLAIASRNNELILMHLLFRITSCFELGNIDQLDRDIATYVEIAESLNQPQSLWYAHSLKAAQALMRGRFEDAAVHAERLFAIGGRIHDVNALNSFGIHAAIHLWEMDRTAEVLPFADQFVEKYPLIPAWQFSRAFMYFEAGHIETARIMFDTLAQNSFARIPQNEQWSISSVLAADLCYRLEDPERSEVLYAQLAPAKSLYCVIGFGVANLGSIALRLAMLASVCGKWDVADEHFEDAIRMEESIGCLPWLAHALYWYAKSASSRGRANLKRAKALCARGREVTGMVQMPKVTRKLQELSRSLEQTGSPPCGSERDEL